MKRLFLQLCFCAVCFTMQAQTPVLKFNNKGELKIAKSTDTHLDLSTEYRRGQSAKTIDQMNYILDEERPDLVIFTGDGETHGRRLEDDSGAYRVAQPSLLRDIR